MAATNFEPQSKLLRTMVLSPNRQAAWGTPLSDASLTRIQRFDGSAVLDLNPLRRSDQNMSGKGTHFATNGQIIGWDLKLSGVKCEMSDWLAGYVLAFCMGKDVVTGSAAPYTHTFTFDESTNQAIPTTVYLQDTAGLIYRVPDMHVTSVTITIPQQGAIQLEFDFIGTGYMVYTAMAALPAVPTESYILGNDADFKLSNAGVAPVSILGRNRTTTLKLDYQSVVNRATGTGLYGNFIRKGSPKFSLSSTIAATAVDDIWTRMVNNTSTALALSANSGAALQFGISVPAANLKTTKMGFEDDMVVWNVEADETTCYQQAGVPPIILTVVNSTPAYMAVGA